MPITSNMGLNTPSVGDTDYPTKVSASFPLIDAHDHSTGKGVQISTAGIADAAITTVKILDANITKAKLAALGQQLSSSSGAFSMSSTTLADVTNLSVSITTTGRPVCIKVISDASANASSLQIVSVVGANGVTEGIAAIFRDAVKIANVFLGRGDDPVPIVARVSYPVSSLETVDIVAAGTYTYKVQVALAGGSPALSQMQVNYAKLIAFEL